MNHLIRPVAGTMSAGLASEICVLTVTGHSFFFTGTLVLLGCEELSYATYISHEWGEFGVLTPKLIAVTPLIRSAMLVAYVVNQGLHTHQNLHLLVLQDCLLVYRGQHGRADGLPWMLCKWGGINWYMQSKLNG